MLFIRKNTGTNFKNFWKEKALPAYKYYLVPRKTDSMKNLLKYQMASKKVRPNKNTSNPEEPKRHEITIHSGFVSNTEGINAMGKKEKTVAEKGK